MLPHVGQPAAFVIPIAAMRSAGAAAVVDAGPVPQARALVLASAVLDISDFKFATIDGAGPATRALTNADFDKLTGSNSGDTDVALNASSGGSAPAPAPIADGGIDVPPRLRGDVFSGR